MFPTVLVLVSLAGAGLVAILARAARRADEDVINDRLARFAGVNRDLQL